MFLFCTLCTVLFFLCFVRFLREFAIFFFFFSFKMCWDTKQIVCIVFVFGSLFVGLLLFVCVCVCVWFFLEICLNVPNWSKTDSGITCNAFENHWTSDYRCALYAMDLGTEIELYPNQSWFVRLFLCEFLLWFGVCLFPLIFFLWGKQRVDTGNILKTHK